MNNLKEDLQRDYELFINQQDEWGFFSGLANYVESIIKNPEMIKIVKKINEEKEQYEQKILNLETEGIDTIKKLEKTLRNKIAH